MRGDGVGDSEGVKGDGMASLTAPGSVTLGTVRGREADEGKWLWVHHGPDLSEGHEG